MAPATRSQVLSTFDRATRATDDGLPSRTSLLCSSALDGVDVMPPASALGLNLSKGSSVALAHLNHAARADNNDYQRAYLRYAAHPLVFNPRVAKFGLLRQHIEYCLPISLHNTSLVLKRYRVSSLYLDTASARGRLRCRYVAVKLAPGMKADLMVIFRGDTPGDVDGTLEVTSQDGVASIRITATVKTPMEFSNAVARYSKPAGSEDDARGSGEAAAAAAATDKAFAEYLVPLGHTNPSVVPLLPPKPES